MCGVSFNTIVRKRQRVCMFVFVYCPLYFKVTTLLFLQTTRIEFDLPEYCVRRRYQDFDWLRIKLEDSQPTHLIPVGRTNHDAKPSHHPAFQLILHSLLCFPLLIFSSRCQRSS